MLQIVVREFGGPEMLDVVEVADPSPGAGEVRVHLRCIGMNHADMMMRAGEYRLSSGDAPFTPGVEGGGVVDAVGEGVDPSWLGRRVVLGATTRPITGPRPFQPGQSLGGTYRSHYLCPVEDVVPAGDGVPDDHLGSLWLAYLTAWGCLAWKQDIQAGQSVLLTAASSPVAWAGAQICRSRGARTIGLTTSPAKAATILAMKDQPYDLILCSRDESGAARAWTNEVRRLTGPEGIRCVFDPVGAGPYMDQLIKVLGQFGTIWIYGLLGEVGPVNLFPLIRKYAGIRGWLLGELVEHGPVREGMEEVLRHVASGEWRLPIAGSYPLREARQAQEIMAKANHLGKMILVP